LASSFDKISDWTVQRLASFVAKTVQDSPPPLPANVRAGTITAVNSLVVNDQLQLSPQAVAYLKTKLGLP
jgi:hypothetical protein